MKGVKMTEILVIVTGGVVQDIRANRKIKVMVHDWDNPSREVWDVPARWNIRRKEQRGVRLELGKYEIRITKHWYGLYRSRVIGAFSLGFIHFIRKEQRR